MSPVTGEREDLTLPFTCPECGDTASREDYARRDYACAGCNLSVAHVELAPTGAVREVYGWLLTEGQVLADRYRVVGLLGRGGFAATYAVEDIRLSNRRCALKEVPRLLFDDGEMEILARLHHRGIPDIRDRFEVGDMVYLVLEFGGSRSLSAERVERGGRIPAPILIPWIRQLCDVLRYLHSQDPPIVHRDLKPGNVLLNENGQINLIDFGIAKEDDASTQTRTIARSATHGFSPPEQVLGTGTDQRSDVYALGATLYVLLTGHKPPPAHERVAGAELTRPSAIVPDTSPTLENLILRSMELNINQRVQSIAEFEAGLEAEETGKAAPPVASAGARPVAPAAEGPTAGGPTGLPGNLAYGETLSMGPEAATVHLQRPEKSKSRLPLILAAAAVLVAVAAGAMLMLNDDSGSGERAVAETPAPAEPAAESQLPTAGQPAPSSPGSAATPAPVFPPPQPTAAAAPAPSGPSASEIFKRRRAEVAPEPEPEPAPVVTRKPKRVEPPAAAPPREPAPARTVVREPAPAKTSPAKQPTGSATEPDEPVDWGGGFESKGAVKTR